MSEDQDQLVEMRIETLSQGEVLDRANEALSEVLKHCSDYPLLSKPRKVKIEIQIAPGQHPATQETFVSAKFFAAAELPKLFGNDDCAFLREGKFRVRQSQGTETLDENQMHFDELKARREAQGGE